MFQKLFHGGESVHSDKLGHRADFGFGKPQVQKSARDVNCVGDVLHSDVARHVIDDERAGSVDNRVSW